VNELVLLSGSRAQDAGYAALADVATITERLGADYRLIGGHMVSMLVALHQVTGVPARETVDADLGAEYCVAADPRLVETLQELGYVRPGAANRFVRPLSDGLEATIDVLVPSYTGRHEPNQKHGDLVVDEVPGLSYALAVTPVRVAADIQLTTGRCIRATILVPAPLPALALKLLSYGSRYATKDSEDVWRLLAVCHAAGIGPGDWARSSVTLRDAALVLSRFATINSPALREITSDRTTRTRIRALAAAVGPGDW